MKQWWIRNFFSINNLKLEREYRREKKKSRFILSSLFVYNRTYSEKYRKKLLEFIIFLL